MKIFILSAASPLRGGIAQFVGLLYNELGKAHDVKVLTFKRQYPSFLFPGKSQTESEQSDVIVNSEVIVDSINPFNWISIGKKIRKESPDLLIFKYWMPFFAPCFGKISRIAKSNGRTKVLVICDNVIPHERRSGDILLTKYFFKSVDYFVLMSEKVKQDLLGLFPLSKNKIIPHPVYSNFGKPVPMAQAKTFLNINSEKVILFFGFIRDYKGLDTLIEALSIARKKINVELLVAGEFYSSSEKYISLIKKLKLNDYVHMFSNFIPTSEVKYYFSAADAVVLPYKDATQSGIVQIANNFLKPVIATNVGGLGEVIENGKTGYVVNKENPDELAEAIVRFYSEKGNINFELNIEKASERYSWKNFVGELTELVSTNLKEN